MYIFARTREIHPAHARDGVAAAVEAGARANAITGLQIFVWSTLFSAPVGTVVWSCRVDQLDELITAQDALFASDEFDSFIRERDDLFVGPLADTVSEVVYGAPTEGPGAFVQTVRAVCANGSLSEGLHTGIELAEAAKRITGRSTMVVTPVAGTYGSVGWISSFDDLGSMAAANAQLAADADWLKLVDRAGHVYAPGTDATILRRIN